MQPAFANPPRGSITISAAVPANCLLRSPASLDFGRYNAAQTKNGTIDATGDVLSIACTKGSPGVYVALDNGRNYSGIHRNLGARDGKSLIAYEIYTSPDHSTAWTSVNTVSYAPASDAPTSLVMYGRAFPGRGPRPGRYADTILAMVNF